MVTALTIMVNFVAFVMTPKEAGLTLLIYLLLGIVGVPVFVGGCISMYAVNRISVWATLLTAVIPFLFGDVVKVVIAAMMAVRVSKFRVGA